MECGRVREYDGEHISVNVRLNVSANRTRQLRSRVWRAVMQCGRVNVGE